jgi:hypothetical protein
LAKLVAGSSLAATAMAILLLLRSIDDDDENVSLDALAAHHT